MKRSPIFYGLLLKMKLSCLNSTDKPVICPSAMMLPSRSQLEYFETCFWYAGSLLIGSSRAVDRDTPQRNSAQAGWVSKVLSAKAFSCFCHRYASQFGVSSCQPLLGNTAVVQVHVCWSLWNLGSWDPRSSSDNVTWDNHHAVARKYVKCCPRREPGLRDDRRRCSSSVCTDVSRLCFSFGFVRKPEQNLFGWPFKREYLASFIFWSPLFKPR